MTVETWTDLERYGCVHVAVTLDDGTRHKRTLHPYDDRDYQDLRIADLFWRHAEIVAALVPGDDFTHEQRAAAVLTDRCLAVERLFPHLRDRLPA